MAKLFAAKLLSTPWLFHVSLANAQQATIRYRANTKSQPDLIGQTNNGDWIVIEAKGRTNSFDSRALLKAKSQASTVRTINSTAPQVRVALQACFQPALFVSMDDPPEQVGRSCNLELDVSTAIERYYAFATIIADQPTDTRQVAGRTYLTRTERDSGVTIGIDATVVETLKENKGLELQKRLKELVRLPAESSVQANIYPDGLLVELDHRWDLDLMELEPEARRNI